MRKVFNQNEVLSCIYHWHNLRGSPGQCVLRNQLSRAEVLIYSQFADFRGVILTMAEFKIPTWCHWTWKRDRVCTAGSCKQYQLAPAHRWWDLDMFAQWVGRSICWHIYESGVKISSGFSAQRCCHRSGDVWICHMHRCFFWCLTTLLLEPPWFWSSGATLFYTCCPGEQSHFHWCNFCLFPS